MPVNRIKEAKQTVQNEIALNSWTVGQQATHTGLRLFQTAGFDTKVPMLVGAAAVHPAPH